MWQTWGLTWRLKLQDQWSFAVFCYHFFFHMKTGLIFQSAVITLSVIACQKHSCSYFIPMIPRNISPPDHQSQACLRGSHIWAVCVHWLFQCSESAQGQRIAGTGLVAFSGQQENNRARWACWFQQGRWRVLAGACPSILVRQWETSGVGHAEWF